MEILLLARGSKNQFAVGGGGSLDTPRGASGEVGLVNRSQQSIYSTAGVQNET